MPGPSHDGPRVHNVGDRLRVLTLNSPHRQSVYAEDDPTWPLHNEGPWGLLVALALHALPGAERFAHVGVGFGAVARALSEVCTYRQTRKGHRPVHIGVDIGETITQVCQAAPEGFYSFDSLHGEGVAAWLDAGPPGFDVVIEDAFDGIAKPREVFQSAYDLARLGRVFISNCIDGLQAREMISRINVPHVWCVRVPEHSNVIVVARPEVFAPRDWVRDLRIRIERDDRLTEVWAPVEF